MTEYPGEGCTKLLVLGKELSTLQDTTAGRAVRYPLTVGRPASRMPASSSSVAKCTIRVTGNRRDSQRRLGPGVPLLAAAVISAAALDVER